MLPVTINDGNEMSDKVQISYQYKSDGLVTVLYCDSVFVEHNAVVLLV